MYRVQWSWDLNMLINFSPFSVHDHLLPWHGSGEQRESISQFPLPPPPSHPSQPVRRGRENEKVTRSLSPPPHTIALPPLTPDLARRNEDFEIPVSAPSVHMRLHPCDTGVVYMHETLPMCYICTVQCQYTVICVQCVMFSA